MALEAVIYQQDLFGHSQKEFYNLLGNGNWNTYGYDHFTLLEKDETKLVNCFLENQTENNFLNNSTTSPSSSIFPNHFDEMLQINPSHQDLANTTTIYANTVLTSTDAVSELLSDQNQQLAEEETAVPATRAKRRRARSRKNKEEIENQRMTHIAVERNRRKQMNEYLSVLRSLMPESYVQRGDQASIIGGAINFVKELEQRLQLLGGHKEISKEGDDNIINNNESKILLPFSEFFTFPQYSTEKTRTDDSVLTHANETSVTGLINIADIEVTMVESHANIKIRSARRPKQLLKIVSSLHSMRLTILHLNVTTVDRIVLYSLSVKVEEDCKLNSVDEIATSIYQLLGRIQEEYSMLN